MERGDLRFKPWDMRRRLLFDTRKTERLREGCLRIGVYHHVNVEVKDNTPSGTTRRAV